MTTQDPRDLHPGPGMDLPAAADADITDALRWQLRGLRRDEPPASDLWAGIAAALPAQSRMPQPASRAAGSRAVPAWLAPSAMAASLLLAVGLVGWWQSAPPARPSAAAGSAQALQREAGAMTRHYQAALQELAPAGIGNSPGDLQPVFEVLDRDAALIRAALAQAPDSRLLLQQLQRTYARRLALTQRVAYS